MRKHTHIFLSGCLISASLLGEQITTYEKSKGESFYSPFGKRDPFKVPSVGGLGDDTTLGPLLRYHVDQYKLRAILRGMGEPKAMFQDPQGKSHIVFQGDTIGIEKATVSRIIKSEVIVTERTFNYLGKESLLEKVISLPQGSELEPIQLIDGGPKGGGEKSPEPRAEGAEKSTFEFKQESVASGKKEPASMASESVGNAPGTKTSVSEASSTAKSEEVSPGEAPKEAQP